MKTFIFRITDLLNGLLTLTGVILTALAVTGILTAVYFLASEIATF